MPLRAGSLRFHLTIQSPNPTQNEFGEPDQVQPYVYFADVWSSMEPLKGNEKYVADQRFGQVDAKFKFRYIVGLTADMRILVGDDAYDIREILNINNLNRELEVLATKMRT